MVVLALYLKEIFTQERPIRRPWKMNRSEGTEGMNSKWRRRAEYARAQDLWRKDPSQCVKRIINDQMDQEPGLPKELMEPFWKAVFTKETAVAPSLPEPDRNLGALWAPVQVCEVKRAYPPNSTSAGPDGLRVKQLKGVCLG